MPSNYRLDQLHPKVSKTLEMVHHISNMDSMHLHGSIHPSFHHGRCFFWQRRNVLTRVVDWKSQQTKINKNVVFDLDLGTFKMPPTKKNTSSNVGVFQKNHQIQARSRIFGDRWLSCWTDLRPFGAGRFEKKTLLSTQLKPNMCY